jgi:hypothetical protein
MIVISDLERMWKETIVEYFDVLPQHLSGWAERNSETPQFRSPVSRLRNEYGAFQIGYRGDAATFGKILSLTQALEVYREDRNKNGTVEDTQLQAPLKPNLNKAE